MNKNRKFLFCVESTQSRVKIESLLFSHFLGKKKEPVPGGSGSSGGSGLAIGVSIGVIVVLILAVVGLFLWRRYQIFPLKNAVDVFPIM